MRNPFRRAVTPLPTPPDPTLRELVIQLSSTVGELKAELASIRFEWAEVLDKINRWSAREAARRRRDVGASLAAPEVQGPTDGQPTVDDRAQGKLALWRKAQG